MLKHWLYGSGIRVSFAEGGAEGGGGGGEGGDGGQEWHADFPGLSAESLKLLSKYDSPEKALASVADKEAMIRQPFRLPKDLSKLTEEQASEFQKGLNALRGVPESADGYSLTLGEDVAVDDETMAEFRQMMFARGATEKEAQDTLDLYNRYVAKMRGTREEMIKDMTQKNYDQFVKELGSAADADLRTRWIKEYLQTFCLGEDGKPNKDVWEAFAKRILYEDRIIELPLARALSEPAKMARAGGGAPGGTGAGPDLAKGALSYPEMAKK